MKALLSLKSAINPSTLLRSIKLRGQNTEIIDSCNKRKYILESAWINQSSVFSIIALILIAPFAFPNIASAEALQTSGTNSALVFQINTELSNKNSNTPAGPVISPLAIALHAYLAKYNSPLQNYTPELLSQAQWPKIVAISFVESNMCIHNLNNNCSGIGGPGHFRRYQDLGGWVDDMGNLLDQRYQGWTINQMDGVYVQPRSANWAYGSQRILTELQAVQASASQQQATVVKNAAANHPVQLATILE